jgi:hypothetical protein
MHSDWFNGTEILQRRWQHGEKVGYCYPSGLEKTLYKWEIYVPLVTKGSSKCFSNKSTELQVTIGPKETAAYPKAMHKHTRRYPT